MVKIMPLDKFNQTIRNVKSKLDEASLEIDKIITYYKNVNNEHLSKTELKKLKELNSINERLLKINIKMKLEK